MPAAIPTCWPSAAANKLDERKVRARAVSDEPAAAAGKAAGRTAAGGSARSCPTSRNSRWNRCRRRWRRRPRSIAKLEAKLADPRLFSSDPAAFSKTAAALEAERAALAAMEHEWLELEMLREEIEG